jgi:hypothetical protein
VEGTGLKWSLVATRDIWSADSIASAEIHHSTGTSSYST